MKLRLLLEGSNSFFPTITFSRQSRKDRLSEVADTDGEIHLALDRLLMLSENVYICFGGS